MGRRGTSSRCGAILAFVVLVLLAWASGAQAASLKGRPLVQIVLGGNSDDNVGADVLPLDADGDGKLELLQFNGFRFMRLFRFDGDLGRWSKVWEIRNASGRTNRDLLHRDRWAFVDVDGDGRDEIIGCWATPGRKSRSLVIRNAMTGTILRSRDLQDSNGSECRLTATRMVGGPGIVIMVAKEALPADGCYKGYLDTLSRITAYDAQLSTMWSKSTCDAGHHFRPLDENRDGIAEAVSVGKYLVARNGATRCVYPGWGTDHIDSVTIDDIDPGQPGLEMLTAGMTGVRMFRAASCELLWFIPLDVLPNPQSVFVGRIDPTDPDWKTVLTLTKNTALNLRLDPTSGTIMGVFATDSDLKNVAQLDGEGIEEGISQFGDVYDATGTLRLSRQWYWNLQTLTATEQALVPEGQWSIRALTADLDRDGKDELIVWGRKKLVIGRVSAVP